MSVVLEFGIRTSSHVKSVHLVGSWDRYQRQLSLKTDLRRQDGVWRGVFQFQGSSVQPGSRYWYYYVLDGTHVVHDPSKMATVEPTTGRTLNILDTPPMAWPSTPQSSYPSSPRSPISIDISVARGRALSPHKIVSPKPMKPHESRRIIDGQYNYLDDDWVSDMDRLNLESRNSVRSTATSIADSAVPSLVTSHTYSSDFSSSSSSISSSGSSSCVCQRFGITRTGTRVRLDCGGALCGSSDDASSLCSDDESPITPHDRPSGIRIDTSVRVSDDNYSPVSSGSLAVPQDTLKSASTHINSIYSGPLRMSDVRRRR